MTARLAGWWRVLLWALGLSAILAGAAHAHTRSESHSVWEINGANVDLVMTIGEVELRRLAPAAGPPPSDAQVTGYLAARVYPSAAGRRCALVPPVETLSATAGYRKYDFTFRCPSATEISITSRAFFDVAPTHTNFAQIQNAASGEFTEQLITRDRQTVEVTGGEDSKLLTASFLDFIRMGVMHIFTGVDHMSFLLGLVLISRRLRDLVFVVTGFTIGHSLTLALAVTGIIRPHAEYIDALVALTIALIGAENVAVQTRRPAAVAAGVALLLAGMAGLKILGLGGLPSLLLLGAGLFTSNYLMVSGRLQDAGRLRMVITLVFGLIHGFGFAAGLLEMQIPPVRLGELLVGFNIGVEIGQLTLVLAASLAVVALTRLKLAPPRAIVVDVASAFLAGLGVFWFVSRSYA
ncbi:HupE/UreJ family protein [Phenylobacterium hankyongense]|uniref:HupE/UreJ family protein n=1 Tax=Phenylobacterium hankyongense TaxID=1813876 RepID=A0A328B106_9CAUL|nr:HupE/UreJ family protein [Phenylobacterium hankyongense]RAK60255.1 HupE/UreJ family protein [Phenylobacterium hankyongense]